MTRLREFLHHLPFIAIALLCLAVALLADGFAHKAAAMNLGYVFIGFTAFGLGVRWVFKLVGIEIADIFDKGDDDATGAAILSAAFVLGVAFVVGSVLH
jgi:hypothetical protein